PPSAVPLPRDQGKIRDGTLLPLRIEPDRHRAVIDQRNLHVGGEDAVGDRNAVAAKGFGKMLVEALAFVGRGGGGEAGAVALRLGGERELADDEGSTPGVQQRAVHAAFLVAEDAQVRDLAREPGGLFLGVAAHGADKNSQARAYRSRDGFVHGDGRLRNALDEGSHGVQLPSFTCWRSHPARTGLRKVPASRWR